MNSKIQGGRANYGQLAGILMLDSLIPRIPGDPGHAETLPFPVRYGIIKGFPFEDLVNIKRDNLHLIIEAARSLETEGVRFIAADCGLFGPFQADIVNELTIPFLGSSLDLIPLFSRFLPSDKKIGIITGDTRILKDEHLRACGKDLSQLMIIGLENCPEFKAVVLERGMMLDVENMRQGVLAASRNLLNNRRNLGAVILECTNLISFRHDIQKILGVPVYDLVSLIEFFAAGYRTKMFSSQYI